MLSLGRRLVPLLLCISHMASILPTFFLGGRCTEPFIIDPLPLGSESMESRSSLIGTVLGILSVLWIIWMRMHLILWSSWANAWWFGVPTRRFVVFLQKKQDLSWSSYGTDWGGRENGKPNLPSTIFVEAWLGNGFSYAKSDEDLIISRLHHPMKFDFLMPSQQQMKFSFSLRFLGPSPASFWEPIYIYTPAKCRVIHPSI